MFKRKKYQLQDFLDNNTWLIFRLDAFFEEAIVDIYVVMDLPSGMILSSALTETELSQKQVDKLLEQALSKNKKAPTKILLSDPDPVRMFLEKSANNLGVKFEAVAARSLEDLVDPVKSAFAEKFSASTESRDDIENEDDEREYREAKQSLPDSYDFCSCGSGAKYKFCCKRIFAETLEAMCFAEDGDFKEALDWIEKARKIVGNTAEVLCRESIVYSFFDAKKSKKLLAECLKVNPKHPRAHYIQAIESDGEGDLEGAAESYKKAISYYPTTDRYHLNETHNNLGYVYYRMGEREKAKSEWETALRLLPSDRIARRNLEDLIYNKTSSGMFRSLFP